MGQLCVLPFIILAKNSGIYQAIQLTLVFAVIFGGYFCLFAKEKLPAYYDDNKIGYFVDGPFRMNIMDLHFNNSNWLYIVKYIRIWCFVMMNLTSVLYLIVYLIFIWFSNYVGQWIIASAVPFIVFVTTIFGLLLPVYYIGKKYE